MRVSAALSSAVLLLLAPHSAEAQTGSLAGHVVDATSGRPIGAAEVFVVGTELRAVTELSGEYLLEGLPLGPRQVGVRRIGYGEIAEDVTISAEATGLVDFGLHAEPLRLDDVVVTGTPSPRGTRRRAVGNAVTTVPVADIQQDAVATTFQELLAGRAPGLRFTRLSGNSAPAPRSRCAGSAASIWDGRSRWSTWTASA